MHPMLLDPVFAHIVYIAEAWPATASTVADTAGRFEAYVSLSRESYQHSWPD